MTVTPKLSIGKGTRILARKGSRGGARRPAGASRARVLADDLLDRLRRQAVERSNGELEVLLLRVLELRVREAAQTLDEEHHRRDACPRDLGGVVERAAREPVGLAGDLADRLLGELDQAVVEQDRLDAPEPLPRDVYVLVARDPFRCLRRLGEHGGELRRVQVTLVEEALRGLDDRRDDARLGDDAAHRADGAFAGSLGDFPDLELEPRSAGERVAALVHRSGAGVRGLATERDLGTLDAERAEADPER